MIGTPGQAIPVTARVYRIMPSNLEGGMATAQEFHRIAMSLHGTMSAPHFERTAFKVARIYATLAPDGRTANLKLEVDEQELKCVTAPDAFQPVPNAWGKQGWTTATLAALSPNELTNALELAWHHALPRKRPRSPSRKGMI